MTARAYGIVRRDISGPDTTRHISEIRAEAARRGLDLIGVLDTDNDDFALLLGTLAPAISMLLVPSLAHVQAWMAAIPDEVTVVPLPRELEQPQPVTSASPERDQP